MDNHLSEVGASEKLLLCGGLRCSNRQLALWYNGHGNVMGWVENEGAQALPLHRREYDP